MHLSFHLQGMRSFAPSGNRQFRNPLSGQNLAAMAALDSPATWTRLIAIGRRSFDGVVYPLSASFVDGQNAGAPCF